MAVLVSAVVAGLYVASCGRFGKNENWQGDLLLLVCRECGIRLLFRGEPLGASMAV